MDASAALSVENWIMGVREDPGDVAPIIVGCQGRRCTFRLRPETTPNRIRVGECSPRPLRGGLPPFSVKSISSREWSGLAGDTQLRRQRPPSATPMPLVPTSKSRSSRREAGSIRSISSRGVSARSGPSVPFVEDSRYCKAVAGNTAEVSIRSSIAFRESASQCHSTPGIASGPALPLPDEKLVCRCSSKLPGPFPSLPSALGYVASRGHSCTDTLLQLLLPTAAAAPWPTEEASGTCAPSKPRPSRPVREMADWLLLLQEGTSRGVACRQLDSMLCPPAQSYADGSLRCEGGRGGRCCRCAGCCCCCC